MAVLGKRKASEPAAAAVSEEDANEIFRRHFEARFAPIETPQEKRRRAMEDGNEDEDDAGRADEEEEGEGGNDDPEWGGLSDDEISDDDNNNDDDDNDEVEVEVVDHSTSQTPKATTMSKRDLKAFMSSRPPDPTAKPQPDAKPSQNPTTSTLPEDAPSLLAQDLELRRLLSESHLLSSPTLSTTNGTAAEPKLFTSGRIRAKATDLRMQALGSQTSIFKQESMPMKLRKGMVARAEAREEKRRREARENGIILERPAAGKKSKGRERRREIGVDRPGMGRLRGAELRLNEHDVKKIEGSRDTFGRKGGKRR